MQKRIVILGGGESGVGAAVLAKAKGFDTFLSDMGTIAPLIPPYSTNGKYHTSTAIPTHPN